VAYPPISVCNPAGNKIQNSHNATPNKVHELEDNIRDEWLLWGGCLMGRCQLSALMAWFYPVATCTEQVNGNQPNAYASRMADCDMIN